MLGEGEGGEGMLFFSWFKRIEGGELIGSCRVR